MTKLALAALAAVSLTPAASATNLFSTTPNLSAGWGSDFSVNQNLGFRTYDNFILPDGGTVQVVSWDFFFLNFNAPLPGGTQPLPEVTQWVVGFFADNAGAPGGLLLQETFAPGDVSEVKWGDATFNVGQSYPIGLYHYSATLTNPFLAGEDTPYWLSVMAISDNYTSNAAVWMGGTGGYQSNSFQEFLGAGMAVTGSALRSGDRAFSLEGEVPEPSTLLLTAVPLLLAGLRRRMARG